MTSARRDSLLTRIDQEVEAGRLWRAKEIIRGTIGHTWPDADVIERYGQILLRMGEELEAGKYLWLSGAHRPEYEHAITLFLRRHARHGRAILLAQLPKSFRRIPFDELPPPVRTELKEYGVGVSYFGPDRSSGAQGRTTRWDQVVLTIIAAVFVVSVFVGFWTGFRVIVSWIVRAIR